MSEKLLKLIEEYGEACKQHGIAIGKEKGFVAAAERVYLAHKALMNELGIEDNEVPPYSLNVHPRAGQFWLQHKTVVGYVADVTAAGLLAEWERAVRQNEPALEPMKNAITGALTVLTEVQHRLDALEAATIHSPEQGGVEGVADVADESLNEERAEG